MRLIKWFLGSAIVVLLCIGLQRFCYKRTGGFAFYKICSALQTDPRWEIPPLSSKERETLEHIFERPFYYLGKGAQAYVFASEEGNHVIKFCRFDHLRPPLWWISSILPFAWERARLERLVHKRGRLEQELDSYKIAFTDMKEETGLIYIHLNKGSEWKRKITLYDKGGVSHSVDLDQMEFLVQKKASLVYPTLAQLMQEGNETLARSHIASLIDLLRSRCTLGIFDKDPDLITNFGFIQGKAVQIDVGRFLLREEMQTPLEIHEELVRITRRFRNWLEEEYPSLAPYLEETLGSHV
jgi:hypothetical protein